MKSADELEERVAGNKGQRGSGLVRSALEIAARGWPVFPLRPGRKEPAIRNWERRATTDPDLIRRTWEVAPWNIGVACGPAALLVVDLDAGDRGDHGRQRLAALAAGAGQVIPADTYTVLTPGGEHLYFLAGDGGYRNTAGRLGAKIDTRGSGGYVVGAGSAVAGRRYRIACDLDPAALPGWIADRLAMTPPTPTPASVHTGSSNYIAAALRGEVRRVAEATAGNRNHSLFVAAVRLGRFVHAGRLEEGMVRDALLRAVDRHRGPGGLTDGEITRTIASGLRRYGSATSGTPSPTSAERHRSR